MHAINHLIGKLITDMDNHKHSIALYMDLSKAFDTINHKILLQKMEHYGIRGLALKWFQDYLNNRKQRVTFNLKNSKLIKSNTTTITTGVPQGSILGPTLFLIYINDLHKQLKSLPILFADDTTLYITDSCIEDAFIKLHEDATILFDWCKANYLSVNYSKTNYMLFGSGYSKGDIPEIIIEENKIKKVNTCKLLGIHIDEKINWTEHTNKVCLKLKQNLYLLNNIKYLLPKKHIISLYYAHIYPHLIYGLSTWGPMLTRTQIKKIENEQNKAIRYIENKQFVTNYSKLFHDNQIVKFTDLILLDINKFAYKLNNELLPDSITELFLTKPESHTYNTRGKNNLRTVKHNSAIFNKSIFNKSTIEWNKLSQNLKNSLSLKCFAARLKKIYIENYFY